MSVTLMKPRLGFLGVGWIGLNRLEAVVSTGVGVVGAVADVDQERAESVARQHRCDHAGSSLEDLLAADVDGVVIATPSAAHADQAIAALSAGLPVFCQKPLARDAAEARAVVAVAQERDLLLGVDLSYRHVRAFEAAAAALRDQVRDVYALDLRFHNAYGPDKPWFTDPQLSGGGCVIDLGTHLIDVAGWWLETTRFEVLEARLYQAGRLVQRPVEVAEDYAEITLAADDRTIRMTCSWFLPLGSDASIGAVAYGSGRSVEVANAGGSFYDFTAHLNDGTASRTLSSPPDAWGGRALCAWTQKVAEGAGFDTEVADQVPLAETIDEIYGRTR